MIVPRVRVSRALRAFFIVIGGWTIMRVVVLWPASIVVGWPAAKAMLHEHSRAITSARRPQLPKPVDRIVHRLLIAKPVSVGRTEKAEAPPVWLIARDEAQPASRPNYKMADIAPPFLARSTTGRFFGSAWALLRPDSSGAALGTVGTLGGSQAGVRIFYEPGPHGLSLTARLSAPLAMNLGREASIGVGLRGRQLGILVERRIALDHGARNAMSVTAYGGVSDVVLPYGLRLEGYAQLGVVGARSRNGFADGAVSIAHQVVQTGSARLSIGGAISGGVQPGVSRVDIGPELVGSIPISGKPVRVTAGWRQRVAGQAAPGSGPSLTIGFGF
jgi:hypothetical protein